MPLFVAKRCHHTSEYTAKICLSKQKMNRPRISFGLFKKNGVDVWRGGGGQEKRPKDALHERIDL